MRPIHNGSETPQDIHIHITTVLVSLLLYSHGTQILNKVRKKRDKHIYYYNPLWQYLPCQKYLNITGTSLFHKACVCIVIWHEASSSGCVWSPVANKKTVIPSKTKSRDLTGIINQSDCAHKQKKTQVVLEGLSEEKLFLKWYLLTYSLIRQC